VVFQFLELLCGQLYILCVQSGSELGGLDSSLSEQVMILEELPNPDPVSLDLVSDFDQQLINIIDTRKVNVEWLISRLGSSIRLVDHVRQNHALFQEGQVFNISLLISECLDNGFELGIRDNDSKEGQDLFELLRSNLEVIMSVHVLEKGLGVESFSLDQAPKLVKDTRHVRLILSAGWG